MGRKFQGTKEGQSATLRPRAARLSIGTSSVRLRLARICRVGSIRENLGDVGANSVLVGWILRRRIRIFLPIDYGIGQKPRVAARRNLA
jgi:hypothetical protein